MSEPEPEAVPPGKTKICERCETRTAGFGMFGKFCEQCRDEMRVERAERNEPLPPRSHKKQQPLATNLAKEIKEACLQTAAVAAITSPGVYVGVEAAVDEFAAAWANVARQSPTAERYIRALLTGGVWIGAAMASLTMVVSIMVATGRVPPALHPYGWLVVGRSPRLQEWLEQMQRQAPPPPVEDEAEPMAA